MQAYQSIENKSISRRDMLKLSWGALAGLVAVEVGGLALSYMQPRLAAGEFGSVITAGMVDEFPPGSVTHIPNGRFYLTRLEEGGFLAIYQRCTHLGCSVPWEQTANSFICPCYSSSFSADGTLLNPPAPRALDIFPVSIEDGQIKVDTARPVSREGFEIAQVVHP
jgi:cytochrome b6-f complex iron-sulfur subunit